ncbi:MAG TPA: hypothetical protein VFL68_11330 [Pseudolabrys sp.]|jgi:hypothetical protein|nr:hypothetical protein [Pseudolabrys sp.]
MDQAKHKAGFGTWLRRTWNALMCAFEGMDRSPMEEVIDRLDRLERDRRAPVVLRRSQGRRKNG